MKIIHTTESNSTLSPIDLPIMYVSEEPCGLQYIPSMSTDHPGFYRLCSDLI